MAFFNSCLAKLSKIDMNGNIRKKRRKKLATLFFFAMYFCPFCLACSVSVYAIEICDLLFSMVVTLFELADLSNLIKSTVFPLIVSAETILYSFIESGKCGYFHIVSAL